MRELSIDDVEMVSGGAAVEVGFGLLSFGLGIVAAAGIGAASVGAAFAVAPIAASIGVWSFFAGGLTLGTAYIEAVPSNSDIGSAGSTNDWSNC